MCNDAIETQRCRADDSVKSVDAMAEKRLHHCLHVQLRSSWLLGFLLFLALSTIEVL